MTRRPRVILEALQVRENPAGTGRGILDLCRSLAAEDRGLDFTVLVTHPQLFEILDGVPHWRVHECPRARDGALRKAVFTQFGLPELVRRLQGDLLHSLQFLVPLRCSCLQVATVHDLAWLLFPATIEEPRRTYYRWLVPRSLAKVDAIVANSEATAAETARCFPGTAGKIRVTPHGTPTWVLDRDCARPPLGEGPGRSYFLFVGTLEPRKNLGRLVDAYETLLAEEEDRGNGREGVPDLVLVGGRGWKDSRLRRRLFQLRDRGRLHIRDYCGLDELWELYCNALALVFPSLNEGFGLPVLEAMAAGVPVLTSNRSGTAEVAGDKALLVDPESTTEIANGLSRLAFDESLRQSLAAAGPERARRWSWSRTAELTASLYRDLLGGG